MDITCIFEGPASSPRGKEIVSRNEKEIDRLKRNIESFNENFNTHDNREVMKYLLELLEYKKKYGEL